jgi:hypothetical protein
MTKGEQQPRKGPGSGKPVPGKKPTSLDKPGLDDAQLGKVAGGMAAGEGKKKIG